MNDTENWLVHDHFEHEELLSRCYEAVEIEDWESANQVLADFIALLKLHIEMEEQVLYPAYETKTGVPRGPTQSLRGEHNKIVHFIKDMQSIIKSRHSDSALECLAQLENLMIKHHEKEEDIFLPMAGMILKDERQELMNKLSNFDITIKKRKWEI